MSSEANKPEQSVVIVDSIYDMETTPLPFGKRWGQQSFTLDEEHLTALRMGKILALDIRGEYVAFVQFKPDNDVPIRGA